MAGLRVSSVRLTRPVKTAHRGYEGGNCSVGALQVTGGWTAIIVMEHHTEEATMEGQLTAIAEPDGAHLSELILELADSRPGCADHQTLPTEAGIEIPLRANFS